MNSPMGVPGAMAGLDLRVAADVMAGDGRMDAQAVMGVRPGGIVAGCRGAAPGRKPRVVVVVIGSGIGPRLLAKLGGRIVAGMASASQRALTSRP